MKHFDEARQNVLTTLSFQVVEEHVEKICAIFDLKGRCRILAVPAEGKDSAVVQAALQPLFKVAAGPRGAGLHRRYGEWRNRRVRS